MNVAARVSSEKENSFHRKFHILFTREKCENLRKNVYTLQKKLCEHFTKKSENYAKKYGPFKRFFFVIGWVMAIWI